MPYLLHVLIHKQYHYFGVWKQKETLRYETSPAARGDRFQVKFLANWIHPYTKYRFSSTPRGSDILVCSVHSNLERSLLLSTGISRWKCWDSSLMHVSMNYTPFFRWKKESCWVTLSRSLSLPFSHIFMYTNPQGLKYTQQLKQRRAYSFLWHICTKFIYKFFLSLTHIVHTEAKILTAAQG